MFILTIYKMIVIFGREWTKMCPHFILTMIGLKVGCIVPWRTYYMLFCIPCFNHHKNIIKIMSYEILLGQ